MVLRLDVDISGPLKMLNGMLENLKNVDKKLLEGPVAEAIRQDFDEQFKRGGFPDKWEPLAPSTLKQKLRMGEPRLGRSGKPSKGLLQNGSFGVENILIRKGDLRVSWTKRDGPDHVCRAEGGVLIIGSENPYAIYHQSDEPREINRKTGKPRLPRRPLVISNECMRIIAGEASKFIARGAK